MIPCKRFDTINGDFWDYGPGAFLWTEAYGHRAMLLRSVTGHLMMLFMSRQEDNWAMPGQVNAWDGDEEKPTLNPSIVDPMGWHGFLTAGNLISV